MLQNAKVTAFTVSELLMKTQQGRGGGGEVKLHTQTHTSTHRHTHTHTHTHRIALKYKKSTPLFFWFIFICFANTFYQQTRFFKRCKYFHYIIHFFISDYQRSHVLPKDFCEQQHPLLMLFLLILMILKNVQLMV